MTTPNGFAPLDLKAWTRYCIPQSDTREYRVNDVLKSAGGTDASGTPYVTQNLGSGAMRGVLVAVDPTFPSTGGVGSNGLKLFVPAIKTRDWYVWVDDDPNAQFVAIDDGLTPANLVAANVGTFVNFTPGVGGGTNGGSLAALSSSTFGGAAGSGCWKVVKLKPGSTYGANTSWIVQPANHELATAGGAGGGGGGGITALSQASDWNTAKLPAQVTDIAAAATAAANAQTTANTANTAAGTAQTTANNAATAAAAAQTTASAAATKAGQSFYISFNVPTVSDGDLVKIPVELGLTVTKISAVCAAGTTTLTPKIGATPMTNGAVNVSSTKGSSTPSAANVAAAGNDLVFTASSSSSCTGLAVTVTYTRALA